MSKKMGLAILLSTTTLFTNIALADTHLFQLDEKQYTSKDLPESIQQSLYEAELDLYQTKMSLVDEALMQMEIKHRAKESGKTEDEILKQVFQPPKIEEADIQAFYDSKKDQIKQDFEQVKPLIVQALMQEEIANQQAEFLKEIKADKLFEVAFSAPQAPVAEISIEGFPSKGADDAKITLVEFADYQCPHCKNTSEALKKILPQFEKDVKLVFMDYPINRSGISRKIAEGAACAGKQDKFWEYNDLAFTQQEQLKEASVNSLAEELKLDMDAFKSCIDSDYPKEQVAKGENQGQRLGITGTPTLYLNGRKLNFYDINEQLPAEIKKLLKSEN